MNRLGKLFAALGALAGLVSFGFGEVSAEPTMDNDEEMVAETVSMEAAVESAAPQFDYFEEEPPLDGLLWAGKRGITVIQTRSHSKDGRFEFGVFGGVIPNDAFIPYGALGVRAGHFLSESFGVEFLYAKPVDSPSDLEERLVARYPDKLYHVQNNDIMQHIMNVNVGWMPLSGKAALLGQRLTNFDLGLSMGIGWLFAEYRNPVDGTMQFRRTPLGGSDLPGTPMGALGASFRVFILDMLTMRADVNQYFFKKSMGGVSNPTMVTLGVSTMLPAGGN